MFTKCNPLRISSLPRLATRTSQSTTASASRTASRPSAGNFILRCQRRQFGSSTFQSAQSAGQHGVPHSAMGPLAGLAHELDGIAPRFEIDAKDVVILKGPVDFYECLKNKILNAKSRVYLSTLYVGTAEYDLVSTLRTALQKNPNLKLEILTDSLRGTRESPRASCASLLAPLISEFGASRVQIRMYHTPNLTGLRKKVIPKRINEGWGLQHMKLYGIDDEVILSGANLSAEYFVSRVDRYHLFKSAPLANYYYNIHAAVSGMSYDVQPASPESTKDKTALAAGYTLSWPRTNEGPPPLRQPKGFAFHASRVLNPLIRPSATSLPSPPSTPSTSSTSSWFTTKPAPTQKTLIYPLFQLTPLLPSPTATSRPSDPSTSTEYGAMTLLLSSLAAHPLAPVRWTFTSGYFNMTPGIADLLLASVLPNRPAAGERARTEAAASTGAVLTASPYANGFLASGWPSSMLPPAYSHLARTFLAAIHGARLDGRVALLEWRRGTAGQEGGWTYHAKGVWVTLHQAQKVRSSDDGEENAGRVGTKEEAGPSITLVGSSNYSARSYALDLESNALILTRDEGLQRRLREEETRLKEHARAMSLEDYETPERRVGLGVKLAMWFVKVVGGAL